MKINCIYSPPWAELCSVLTQSCPMRAGMEHSSSPALLMGTQLPVGEFSRFQSQMPRAVLRSDPELISSQPRVQLTPSLLDLHKPFQGFLGKSGKSPRVEAARLGSSKNPSAKPSRLTHPAPRKEQRHKLFCISLNLGRNPSCEGGEGLAQLQGLQALDAP